MIFTIQRLGNKNIESIFRSAQFRSLHYRAGSKSRATFAQIPAVSNFLKAKVTESAPLAEAFMNGNFAFGKLGQQNQFRRKFVSLSDLGARVGTSSNFGSLHSLIEGQQKQLGFTRRFSASSKQDQQGVAAKEVKFDYDGKTKTEYVNSPVVGYWLLYCASMCFGIIVWGGLTRLTESGLSIVEWAPISGIKLPTTDAEWEIEFDKYKEFPEYHKVHVGISMEDFKKIYFMEWFHRNIGRLLGLVYVIPAAYFIYKGKIHRKNILKVVGLGSLIGAQGAVGWFMVSSGLNKELADIPGAVPRVSQYRLTMHLGMAYLLYTMFFLYGSKTVKMNRLISGKIKNLDKVRDVVNSRQVGKFQVGVKHITNFAILTCLSGGMVAGLDAGLVYNEFPLMGGKLLPRFEEYWNDSYAEDIFGRAQGMWHNLFENPTTVQMVHRTMAMTMCFGVSYIWYVGRGLKLNRANRVMLNSAFFFVLTQIGLGVGTLVNYVPLAWASAHQANSVLLVATLLGLTNTLKKLPKVV